MFRLASECFGCGDVRTGARRRNAVLPALCDLPRRAACGRAAAAVAVISLHQWRPLPAGRPASSIGPRASGLYCG